MSDMSTTPGTFGGRLRLILRHGPVRPTHLARAIGVHVTTVSRWGSDKQIPDDVMLTAIAHHLGVSEVWLRYGDNEQAADTGLSLPADVVAWYAKGGGDPHRKMAAVLIAYARGRVGRMRRRAPQSSRQSVVEAMLGRPLPPGAQVARIAPDGGRDDTAMDHLVVCENLSYRRLLQARRDALRACGQPHFRRCVYCLQWQEPGALSVSDGSRSFFHDVCRSAYESERREIRESGRPAAQNTATRTLRRHGWHEGRR